MKISALDNANYFLDNSMIFEDVPSEMKFIKILHCVGHHILQQQQVDGA